MKKILLVILGSFILLSTVTFGCPNKKLHDTVTRYMSVSKATHIEEKRLFIASQAVATEAMHSAKGDLKKGKENIKAIVDLLHEYSKSHDLEIIVLKDIKGFIK